MVRGKRVRNAGEECESTEDMMNVERFNVKRR